MKVFSPYLLATAALGLSLTGCDSSTPKKEAAQTADPAATPAAATPAATSPASNAPATAATPGAAASKASEVALPAGLKAGRWQAFLLLPKHAVHFVFEVAVENNKAIGYLVNEGPNGPERLRCAPVRALGDSAIISLPGTEATLVVHADGTDHLGGAWVQPGGKKPTRTTFSAVYGERSPLRPDAATPSFAGSWRATFKSSSGKVYPATVVFAQQGAKLTAALSGPGGSYRYLSGAALPDGMGVSSFDGRNGILLQAQKLPNGTLKGAFYSGKAVHETWTAVTAPQAKEPKK